MNFNHILNSLILSSTFNEKNELFVKNRCAFYTKKKKITFKFSNVRTQNINYLICTRIQCFILYEIDIKIKQIEKYCEIKNKRFNDQIVTR